MSNKRPFDSYGGFNWEKVKADGVFPLYEEPPFEDEQMLKRVWGRKWGVWDEVGELKVVLVHKPQEDEMLAIKGGIYDEEMDWRYDPDSKWLWPGKDLPDMAKLKDQHDSFVEKIRKEGIEVVNIDGKVPGGDGHCMACMSRDYAVAVPGGAIICRMGLDRRRGEEALVAKTIASLGMPILRTIHGTGVFEGGNFIILNQENAVIGRGGLTNEEGERQVEEVLNVLGMNLILTALPGQDEHIDGRVGMIGKNLALVDTEHMSFEFLRKLEELQIKIIPCAFEEPNVLVLHPGKILASHVMSADTKKALEKEGVEVVIHEMRELSKALGGPRCSTCPIVREPA